MTHSEKNNNPETSLLDTEKTLSIKTEEEFHEKIEEVRAEQSARNE